MNRYEPTREGKLVQLRRLIAMVDSGKLSEMETGTNGFKLVSRAREKSLVSGRPLEEELLDLVEAKRGY